MDVLRKYGWIAYEMVLLYNVKFPGHNNCPIPMEEYVLSKRNRLMYLRQNLMMPQLLPNDSLKKTYKSIKNSKSNMYFFRYLKLKR